MKHLLLAALLGVTLAGCSKKTEPDASPATPAVPVVVRPFSSATGSLTIQPHGEPAYTLNGLVLQITATENADKSAVFVYTWHGLTVAGAGVEVVAKTVARSLTDPGTGPWYAAVVTNTTHPDFTNPHALDLAGQGVLTLAPGGYTLKYSAQYLDGLLTQ